MKLLDKVQISNLKVNERRRDVDEGVKLAKKIDLLRETASAEESRLAKFRTETLRLIKEDIDKLIAERDKLKDEVNNLKNGIKY